MHNSILIISKCIHIYRFRIPDFVNELVRDYRHKVKDQDDEHNEWADDSPCCLPEEVGFVANHKLDIIIEPKKRHSPLSKSV